MQYRMIFCVFFLGIILTSGCGQGFKVVGKVTFPDGTPLTVGTVCFTDNTITATGKVNAQGEYKLGMSKEGDGVPPGSYRIYISGATQPSTDPNLQQKDEDGNTFGQMVLAIDPKYSTPERSGLTCDVKASMKHDITVEPPGPNYKPILIKGTSE